MTAWYARTSCAIVQPGPCAHGMPRAAKPQRSAPSPDFHAVVRSFMRSEYCAVAFLRSAGVFWPRRPLPLFVLALGADLLLVALAAVAHELSPLLRVLASATTRNSARMGTKCALEDIATGLRGREDGIRFTTLYIP